MITGINHITITVSDLEKSFDFYSQNLGMKPEVKWASGAYLSAGSLWVCLSVGLPCPSKDYSHIAFNIAEEQFREYSEKLSKLGISTWQENSSEGQSLYILDPDGHKLEIHVGNLSTRLAALKENPYNGLVWF